ncbi:zinc transport system permease protein [Tindallia magadiensis]|uniref:Zinc transport system permease protein n=1 Tax=Tindallia magadiensis TaxID=69895 RepID=A0A1I3BDW9_9FIRM|nr:metal ABC transporter permease [Tindallia magadiensis]SFH60507.1 zinc transport system permease protein [Tindallia magadiensis]
MPEIMQYGFMQRALIAGIFVALICPSIGIFLTLRRLSMIGDTLSHVALAGVAGGILLNFYPIYTALLFTLAASFAIEILRKEFHQYAEVSLAVILSFGIGLATILISMGGAGATVFSYLFGSVTLVSYQDLVSISILGGIILATVLFYYRSLFYMAFDETAARLAGVPVKRINFIFTVLVAMTISISMRIVGILMVSSLMVIPVATSLQLKASFRVTFIASLVFGLISVMGGLVISFYASLAPGGTIVMTSVAVLILVVVMKKLV